jgi:hypothetical protein
MHGQRRREGWRNGLHASPPRGNDSVMSTTLLAIIGSLYVVATFLNKTRTFIQDIKAIWADIGPSCRKAFGYLRHLRTSPAVDGPRLPQVSEIDRRIQTHPQLGPLAAWHR